MYSIQRPKLAQQTSVDQDEFFYKFSIIVSKNKSFEDLKLNISENFNATVLKQGYRMHIDCQIEEKTMVMKNFRLLRYLVYKLLTVCYIIPVNGRAIG